MKVLTFLVVAGALLHSPSLRGEERRDGAVFAEKKDAKNDAIRAEVRRKEEPAPKRRMWVDFSKVDAPKAGEVNPQVSPFLEEVLDRLLTLRPDLPHSRAREDQAPQTDVLRALYARVLAALGGIQPEGSVPPASVSAGPGE